MIETIKIKIEGLNAGKIINLLVDNGIFLKNLKQKQKHVVFEIEKRDELEFKKICKKLHKKYEILSRNIFVNILKKSKLYLGFVVALSLVISFVYSFNLFVFEVNLSASSEKDFDLSQVEKLLKENGYFAGMKKSDIDVSKLQNMIISSQENISGCAIKKNGSRLDIVVYPGLLKENVSKQNIYSKYNAVITKVEVFSGRSKLKQGDFVKTDDLLIENENGASGRITGKIYYSDYLIYNENQLVKEFTGRKIEKTNFVLFGKNILKNENNVDFSNYIEEKCVFLVTENTFFPLSFVKTTYKEFEYHESKISFSEVEENLKENLYKTVLEKICDVHKQKVTNVSYSVVTENNLTRLDCFVECEIDLIAD